MKNRDRAFKKNKTFGFLMPVENSNQHGVFGMSRTSTDKYKSNLYNLIFTGLGQRVMMPTFGTRIPLLIFENLEDDVFIAIKTEIIEAVARWIPEIKIEEVGFEDKLVNLENNKIQMTIKFSLKRDETIQEFIEIEMRV